MSEGLRERKRRSDAFWVYCPKCGQEFARGVSTDYAVICECGEEIIVPKTAG